MIKKCCQIDLFSFVYISICQDAPKCATQRPENVEKSTLSTIYRNAEKCLLYPAFRPGFGFRVNVLVLVYEHIASFYCLGFGNAGI